MALDCLQRVGSNLFVQGWLTWPQARPAPDLAVACGGATLATRLASLHERPDIQGAARNALVAKGFLLIAALDEARAATALDLVVQSGRETCAQPLPEANLGPSVADMLGQSHWRIVFDLLEAAADAPGLDWLLRAGCFGRWLDTVPLVPHGADDQHGLRRIDAIAAPSGECAVAVTLPGPMPEGTELRAVAVLPGEGGSIRLHRLQGPAALRGESLLALYGRLPPEVALPMTVPKLVVELRQPGGGSWFRTRPRALPAPAFLTTLRQLAGAAAAGDTMHSFGWLRAVLEDRQDGLAPLACPAPRALAADTPVVAVLHAIDDPFAARLVLLAAAQIERHAAEILVVGPRPAAEAVADIFLQRGRVPARTSLDLAAAARRGTYARAALVPIDTLALGDALVAGSVDALFDRRIDGAALPALLRLAAVAGTMDGAETLARLAQLLDGGAEALRFGRAEGAFGQLLGDHLAGFWRDAAPGFVATAAHAPA
ncbi:hypothetical protein [Roseomonas sp. CECT 9278]|uniref:hypothetical protein n=1 Tax=Roseomonas sp. CECT 9278 TaxID=2845823 RepID=UPI001E44F8EE|nr:hypothetical protein [Roseomonas sp. CECT 9278]